MAFLGGLLGGGDGADPLDIYGDLFTDKQKAALKQRDLSQGLFRMSEALAKAAQPSPYKPSIGSMVGSLGGALGAFGGGGDETMNKQLQAMQIAEKVRKSKSERAFQEQYFDPLMVNWLRRRAALGSAAAGPPPATAPSPNMPPPPSSPNAPPPPGSGYSGPTNAELGAPPPGSGYSGPTNEELGAPPALLPIPPAPPGGRITPADYGVPNPSGAGGPVTPRPDLGPNVVSQPGQVPYVQPYQPPPAGQKNTGLLPPLDQLVGQDGQPLTGQGVLSMMAASYGGAPGGMPPFQLASATTGGGPGAAGDDYLLDTVIPHYESGGRNIHQQVTSPSVSTAQGPWQITNSTWRDIAPKVGIDVEKYPTAMSVPVPVQREVAKQLMAERGLQPWAPHNKRLADAVGWQGQSARGERPADAVLPREGGGGPGGDMQALQALMQLTGGGGQTEDDPLAALADMTSARGGPDTVLPSAGGGQGLPVRQANAALAPLAIDNAVLGGKSSVAGVGDALSNRILNMQKAMPPQLQERFRIISGERTPKRQIDVYRGSGTPPPMNSRHISGDAVDLLRDPDVLNWIKTNGPGFGVGFPLEATMGPKEANHLEMVDASGNRLSPQDTVIPSGRGIPASALMNVADTGAPGAGGAPAASGQIPGLGIAAEDLALMNMLAKRSGLGEPFNSLLETYYKSPGYLAEKARTEAQATKDVALQMDPLIQTQVDIAKAKVDYEWKPKIEEAVQKLQSPILKEREQAKADIERYSKELEQNRAASQTAVDVNVARDDLTPGATKMNALEFSQRTLELAKRRARGDLAVRPGDIISTPVLTPEQTAAQTQRGKTAEEMVEVEVWTPNGLVKQTMTNQEKAAREKLAAGRGGVGAPQIGDIVSKPVMRPEDQKVADALGEDFIALRRQAVAADKTIRDTHTLRSKLDSGMFTGLDSNLNLFLARLGDTLGYKNLSDAKKVENTQVYIAQLGSEVLSMAQFLKPVSNIDLTFLNSMAGGQNLSAASIRQLLDMREEYARLSIQRHNEEAAGRNPAIFQGARRELPMPPAYQPREMMTPSGNRTTINRD